MLRDPNTSKYWKAKKAKAAYIAALDENYFHFGTPVKPYLGSFNLKYLFLFIKAYVQYLLRKSEHTKTLESFDKEINHYKTDPQLPIYYQ